MDRKTLARAALIAVGATLPTAARPPEAVIASGAAMLVVVETFPVAARQTSTAAGPAPALAAAPQASLPRRAGCPAGATVVPVDVRVDARTVTARLANRAGVAAGAAIVPIGLKIVDTLAATAAARCLAEQDAVRAAVADPGAAVAALAAVIGIEFQLVNTGARATGAEGWATDVATDLVANGAWNTDPGEADFGRRARAVTGGAMVTVALEIDTLAAAAEQTGGTRRVAGATVPLVAVEEKALAAALVAAALAAAVAALAFGASAAVAVPVAVLPNVFAVRGNVRSVSVGEDHPECSAKTGLQGDAARGRECPGQGIESWSVHGSSGFFIRGQEHRLGA